MQSSAAPFVGSRRFRRDEYDLFFGRPREKRELRSLIVAHSVVLVYGASGCGKSSLLDAGVFPLLVEHGCEVLPRAILKGDLPEALAGEEIGNLYVFNILSSWASEGTSAKTLAHQDLAGFLSTLPHTVNEVGDPQLRVAILDQFEELFTFAPERWQERRAVFEQIAAALEADPLLRVVLAMREDFVAQLDPFEDLLPDRLRTRFYVERLGRAAAIEAVEKPIDEKTDRTIDGKASAALVDELLKIQVKGARGEHLEVPGPYIELLQLQIVCNRLWKSLPAEVREIGLEQLHGFLDVSRVLRDYYEEALKGTARSTGVAERALRHWVDTFLITPGGTRGIAYRGVTHTGSGDKGIPNRAAQWLEDEYHLVHAEVRAGGETWYELTHDRFVEPIQASNREWRTEDWTGNVLLWLRQPSNWLKVTVPILIAVVLGTWAARTYWESVLEHQRVVVRIDELLDLDPEDARREADTVLTNVAGYLWQRNDETSLEELAEQLQRAESLIEELQSDQQWVGAVMPRAPKEGSWPLIVTYHPGRNIDEGQLLYQWRTTASWIASNWGVPVATEVRLQPDGSMPSDRLRVTNDYSAASEDLSFTTELGRPRSIVVNGQSEDSRLQKWIDTRKGDWQQLSDIRWGGPWYWAPLWTRPLFEAAGHQTDPKERAFALQVANQLLDRPDLLLNRNNVALVLQRLRKGSEQTVGEALAARGGVDGLVDDLREVVKQDYSILHLQYLLDALAAYPRPDYPTDVAVRFALDDLSSESPGRGVGLAGRRSRHAATDEIETLAKDDAARPYLDIMTSLESEPPIRVYLGDNIIGNFVIPGDELQPEELRPEVVEELVDLRGEVFKRFGYDPPAVRFRHAAADPAGRLGGNAFRIEVVNERHDDGTSDVEAIDVPPAGDAMERVREALRRRYLAYRGWWLSADYVAKRLDALSSQLTDWLFARYSLTDLKILLRNVLEPSEAELDAYRDGRVEAALGSAPIGQSLRELDWLLGSLVFWAQAGDPKDTEWLAESLRQTQRARLEGRPETMPQTRAKAPVLAGIKAMDRTDPERAAALFHEALEEDHEGAVAAFLAAYPRRQVGATAERKELLKVCLPFESPGKLSARRAVDRLQRYEVEDYLTRHGPELATADRATLDYCLLEHYAARGYRRHANTSLASLSKKPLWDELDSDQRYAMGYWSLELDGTPVAPPGRLSQSKAWLDAAFTGWKDEASAEAAFTELLGRYPAGARPSWYLDLLQHLAERRPESIWIPIYLADALANGRNAAEAAQALDWLRRAQARRDRLPEAERVRLAAWDKWIDASARETRASYLEGAEREQLLTDAVEELKALIVHLRHEDKLADDMWPGVIAYTELLRGYRMNNDVKAATRVMVEIEQQPALADRADFLDDHFMLAVGHGRMQEAIQLSEKAREKIGETHALFIGALARLLAADPGGEYWARQLFATQHEYRDYIRLMLYWRLSLDGKSDIARAYLQDRWRKIDPKTWSERLAAGDAQAWREQLIGYYLGKVDRDKLFAPLQTRETFESSPLSRIGVSGLTYDGMRCEAFFYDALLQQANGDPGRYREGLKAVQRTGHADMYEYLMAAYLLSEESSTYEQTATERR